MDPRNTRMTYRQLSTSRICELNVNMKPTLMFPLIWLFFKCLVAELETTTFGVSETTLETTTFDEEEATTGNYGVLQDQLADENNSPPTENSAILDNGDLLEVNKTNSWDEEETTKMQLSVNNCNREISLEGDNSKQIAFSFIPNAAKPRGQCQITISGQKEKLLVLVFSDIRLKRTMQESLKIIAPTKETWFTMKEFLGQEKWAVFLPNTSKVYLIYGYNSAGITGNVNPQFVLTVYSISSNVHV